MKYLCQRDEVDDRDYIFELTLVPLPPHYAIHTNLPDILNQGALGSCVSNEISNALKYCLIKEKKTIIQPSRLFIYYFGRVIQGSPEDQDTGLSIRNGIQAVAKYGACDEIIWPYDITQFKVKPNDLAIQQANTTIPLFKYVSIENSLDHLKSAIHQGHPIVFGMNVYESFEYADTWKSGNVPMPKETEKCLGGHCVAAYGWIDETQCFLMMNSWGTSYGIQGWFYLPYAYVQTYAWDFWQITFY